MIYYSNMAQAITKCRACGNTNLEVVLDLGEQYLTGTFPRSTDGVNISKGPLRLVKCHGTQNVCGLLQLAHNYDLSEMYGTNYGYRSGLNYRMVEHLKKKVESISKLVDLQPEDLVVDIGSNDGTTLGFYPDNLTLVGVDPTAAKFREYYKRHIKVVPEFFSSAAVNKVAPNKKAKVITSFAMFYDLETPLDFVSQIQEVLHADGVWVFEQSYLPLMLETNAYDTVCHEHLEYYGMAQVEWILNQVGMHVVGVELNDTNGGSFSVTATHSSSSIPVNHAQLESIRASESLAAINELSTYEAFRKRVESNRHDLQTLIKGYRSEGKRVCGIGASTKGNVVLQYCGFGPEDIEMIGDVNPDKYGAFTPGSWIPIRSEAEVLDSQPDVLLVLPWHFREFFSMSSIFKGRALLYPLPTIELVTK
jgi:NDP-4-keto-2,6-dideoxyhexose 3-C-methyltransferase